MIYFLQIWLLLSTGVMSAHLLIIQSVEQTLIFGQALLFVRPATANTVRQMSRCLFCMTTEKNCRTHVVEADRY